MCVGGGGMVRSDNNQFNTTKQLYFLSRAAEYMTLAVVR